MINGPRVGFRLSWSDLWNVDTGGEHPAISGNPLDPARQLNGTPRVEASIEVGSASLTGALELNSWNGTTLRVGSDYLTVTSPVDVWIEWDWRTGRRRITVDSEVLVTDLNRTLQGVAYSLSARAYAACGYVNLPSVPDNNWGQAVNFTVELLGAVGGWESDWDETDETTDWSSVNTPQWGSRTATTWTQLWGASSASLAPRWVQSKFVGLRSPHPCAPLPTPDGMLVMAYDRYGSGTSNGDITRERVPGLVGADAVAERTRTVLTAANDEVWFQRNGMVYLAPVKSPDGAQTWQASTGAAALASAPSYEAMGRGVQALHPVVQSVSNQTQTSEHWVLFRRVWKATGADEIYTVCEYGDLFASWPAAGASNLPLYSTFLPSGILEWGAFADGRQQLYRSRDGGATWTKDVDEVTTNAAGLVAVDYWRSPSGIEALVGYDVDAEGIYVTQRTSGDLWDDWALATDVITAPCWPTIFQDTAGRWRIVAFVDRAWRMFQANWPSETWTEVTP